MLLQTNYNGHIDKYEGNFIYGFLVGNVTITYHNGIKYTGAVVDGKSNGKGLMKYTDGSTYEGNWANNDWKGDGTYTSSRGVRYVG